MNFEMPIRNLDCFQCECGCTNYYSNPRMLSEGFYFKKEEYHYSDCDEFCDEDCYEHDGTHYIISVHYFVANEETGEVTYAQKYTMSFRQNYNPFREYQILKDLDALYREHDKMVFIEILENLSTTKMVGEGIPYAIKTVEEDLEFIHMSISDHLAMEKSEDINDDDVPFKINYSIDK